MSCGRLRRHSDANVVAEIGQHRLMRSELEAVTATALDSAEAASLAEAYIKQWATDILFYEKAHATTDPQLEAMVDNYRRSLYLHRYEQLLVDRKMSKKVTDEAIQAYYEQNGDAYRLHEDILKGALIIVPQGAPNLEKVGGWMKHLDRDIEQLEKYAYQYATGYQLFTDEWTSANQVMMRIPSTQPNLSQRMRSTNYVEMEDSTAVYMLLVTDKRFVGDPMPLEYATPMIRTAILQKRRVDFLKGQREAVYQYGQFSQLKVYDY